MHCSKILTLLIPLSSLFKSHLPPPNMEPFSLFVPHHSSNRIARREACTSSHCWLFLVQIPSSHGMQNSISTFLQLCSQVVLEGLGRLCVTIRTRILHAIRKISSNTYWVYFCSLAPRRGVPVFIKISNARPSHNQSLTQIIGKITAFSSFFLRHVIEKAVAKQLWLNQDSSDFLDLSQSDLKPGCGTEPSLVLLVNFSQQWTTTKQTFKNIC